MKKLAITCAATLALALGAYAQGSINLDNSSTGLYGPAINAPGQYYSGTFGLELWELNATTVPAGINVPMTAGYAVAAYNAMTNAGFTLEKTWANKTITTVNAGYIQLGEVDMANVSPKGGTVVLGLAMWNNASSSWGAMLMSANSATRAGIIAFPTGTADYTAQPTPTPADIGPGWNSVGTDLVMMPVPEPGTFALAGLGAAALLI